MKMLLGKPMRLVLSDGRVVEGELDCMDKDINFILRNTKEYHQRSNSGETCLVSLSLSRHSPQLSSLVSEPELGDNFKYLGTVAVPGAHVLKCYSARPL